MAQLTNIRTVSVPSIGKLALAEKPGTFTPSAFKREHKPGRLHEDGGYSETPTPAKLEISVNLTPGVDVTALSGIKDEDVTVRLSDGTVHLMQRAFSSEPVAVTDDTAKVVLMSNKSEAI